MNNYEIARKFGQLMRTANSATVFLINSVGTLSGPKT